MFRPLIRSPWSKYVCNQCRRRLQSRGLASTVVEPAGRFPNTASYNPASHSQQSVAHEDKTLRDIFDSPQVWAQYSQTSKSHLPRAGLFQNKHLTTPSGFTSYAQRTLKKAQRLVDKIVSAHAPDELRRIVKDLDRLSDLLCRVIDLSDFVRATHPERAFVAAANDAYSVMYEYMNVLNTTTGLYDALKRAMEDPAIVAAWSVEEKAVANILFRDFEKSGINLPTQARRRFVELSNEIARIGPEFVNNMAPKTPFLTFCSSQLMGMDPMVVRQLTRGGKVTLPTVGMISYHALRTVEDEEVRRELYIASHTSKDSQIELLEQLLHLRFELAKLVGHPSYASVALSDKMAKSPESVSTFLSSLASSNRPLAQKELDKLSQLKRAHGHTSPLQAWDREFYASKHLHTIQSLNASRNRAPDFLNAYFSLGTVMQGLSRLFSRLYGVRFVPKEVLPGETWNDDVRRLDVVCEKEGRIAVVYCDLFEREGKNPNPAHFTVRCSRRIEDEEFLEEAADADSGRADDGMASSRGPDGALYQLPTIALICDFSRPTPRRDSSSPPTLLSFREVQTLFHEMGHALHSMLGRTALHNVAGTRCATDFAELPSVLMEHFAKDPRVLSIFARHYETDQPLPPELVTSRLSQDSLWESTETQSQIVLAILDQTYHGPEVASDVGTDGRRWDSTALFRQVEHKYDLLPPVDGTTWQGFFGHLFGYGATYYSYLFDRAIAARVWKVVFERDPLEGERGRRYREEVLRWGGGRDAWKCVAGLLGDARLEEGGVWAMGEVGRWGCEVGGRRGVGDERGGEVGV